MKSNLETDLVLPADVLHAGDTARIGRFEIKQPGGGCREFQIYKEGKWIGDRPNISQTMLCVCREILECNDYLVNT